MERSGDKFELTANETDFIEVSDSFYMGTWLALCAISRWSSWISQGD